MSGSIPPFKPSGQGLQHDLKQIKVSEIIAWGAFKGRFRKEYEDVAGIETVNGKEVYKSLKIKQALNETDSDIYKFLLTYGFTKEELEDMYSQITQPDAKVKEVYLQYKIGSSYSEDDFKEALRIIFSYMNGIDYLEVKVRNFTVPKDMDDDDAKLHAKGIQQVGMSWQGNRENMEVGDEWVEGWTRSGSLIVPDPESFLSAVDVRAIKNGGDITDSIPVSILEALAVIASIESGVSAVRIGEPVVSLEIYAGTQYKQVVQTEHVTFPSAQNSLLNKYDQFHELYKDVNSCKDKTDEECDAPVKKTDWSSIIWDSFEQSLLNDVEKETDGLFTAEPYVNLPGKFGIPRGETQVYMTVEGLKNARPDKFGYYVSLFMDLKITKEKGSLLKRLIGGLIRIFLSLIDAVLGVFLKIPILKQVTMIILNTIGAIFGVDMQGARLILSQILMSVMMFFITPFALEAIGLGEVGMTAGAFLPGMSGSFSSSLTLFSQAMSMYSNAQSVAVQYASRKAVISEENAKYAKRKSDLENKVEESYFGTMGSYDQHQDADNMMYEVMFNPFYYWEQAIPSAEINNNKGY